MHKGIMIAGTHSGVGKTTVCLGIMGVLAKRYSVQPFKVGPDYIDTSYHTYVTGNYSCNLDVFLHGEDLVKSLFSKNASQADISVVEGVMGLYDGMDTTSLASSAHIAKLLGIPVILVVDVGAMAASVSAMVMGYVEYDRDVDIAGVILNRVGGEKHYLLLKECIERDLNVEVIGYLPYDRELIFPERHLGLMPPYEMKDLNEKFADLYDKTEKYIDVNKILDVSSELVVYGDKQPTRNIIKDCNVKIAYAFDEAFSFYYKNTIDEFGKWCSLVPFSPLYDEDLPEGISGIYIGGGFPEVFAEQLSNNKNLIKSIRDAIDNGMPVYAECGGFMYLTRSIMDKQGKKYPMVGIYNVDTVMTDRLNHFGYVYVDVTKENVLFNEGEKIRGHEFHYSKVLGEYEDKSYLVHNLTGTEAWPCGYRYKNCLGTYAHVDLSAYPDAIKKFIDIAVRNNS